MKRYTIKNYKGNLLESLSKFAKSHKGMRIVEAIEDKEDLKVRCEEASDSFKVIIFDIDPSEVAAIDRRLITNKHVLDLHRCSWKIESVKDNPNVLEVKILTAYQDIIDKVLKTLEPFGWSVEDGSIIIRDGSENY